jgi:hypothetical protein
MAVDGVERGVSGIEEIGEGGGHTGKCNVWRGLRMGMAGRTLARNFPYTGD